MFNCCYLLDNTFNDDSTLSIGYRVTSGPGLPRVYVKNLLPRVPNLRNFEIISQNISIDLLRIMTEPKMKKSSLRRLGGDFVIIWPADGGLITVTFLWLVREFFLYSDVAFCICWHHGK